MTPATIPQGFVLMCRECERLEGHHSLGCSLRPAQQGDTHHGPQQGDQTWPALAAPQSMPVDMVLYCPKCNTQHIDAPADLCAECPGGDCMCVRQRERWTNPPHKSHLCKGCGHIWRPSDTPTNGVERTASGKDVDTAPSKAAKQGEAVAELRDAAEGVCASLEHPELSVTALQMWRLRDALNAFSPSRPAAAAQS